MDACVRDARAGIVSLVSEPPESSVSAKTLYLKGFVGHPASTLRPCVQTHDDMSSKAITLGIVASAAVMALVFHRLAIIGWFEADAPDLPVSESRVGTSPLKSVDPVSPIPTADETLAHEPLRLDRTNLAAVLDSPDDAIRLHATETLFAQFVDQDFDAARDLIDAVISPSQRVRMRQILATRLAKKDRLRALAWVSSLQDAGEREDAMSVVLGEISMTDPAAAVRMRQDSQTPANDPVLENLAQRWAERDLPAALQWADSLPAGEQRDRVTARAAFIQAQTSPEAAATLIVDRMSAGLAQEEALISVLHQWAQRDIEGAQSWVEKLSSEPVRTRAAAEISATSRARTGTAE